MKHSFFKDKSWQLPFVSNGYRLASFFICVIMKSTHERQRFLRFGHDVRIGRVEDVYSVLDEI